MVFNGSTFGFHPKSLGSNPCVRSKELIVKVKDVRKLREELGKAVADMIMKFEAETGCFVEEFEIDRQGGKEWLVEVDVVVEV